MQLYKLAENYQTVLDKAEELDDGTLKDTLDSIDESFDDKATNTAAVIKTLEGNVSILDEEIKRLTDKKSIMTKNKDNLKKYLVENMIKIQKNKIESPLFKLAIRKSKAVAITDDKKLAIRYLTPQPAKPDKKLIKQDIENGFEVDGAKIVENQSLTIK